MTTLMRFHPLSEDLPTLMERFNRFFGQSPFSRLETDEGLGTWAPRCDIREDGDSILVLAELPGVNGKDIDIQVENNVLTISGERKREKEVKSDNLFRTERFFGSFSRSFSLPVTVDTNGIKADLQDGVLKVTLPKVETAKPRKIKVLSS